MYRRMSRRSSGYGNWRHNLSDKCVLLWYFRELVHELRDSGKTIIAVSHDDRYFHHADRVIKMELGKIVEAGETSTPRS